MLGLGAAALRRGNLAGFAVPAAAIAAFGVVALVDVGERLNWGDGVGVIGYDEPSGGVLLQPALDDLKGDARLSPEGRRAGWALLSEHGYRARPLAGWKIIAFAVPLLAFLTSYQVFRLFLDPAQALKVTVLLSLVVLAWLFLRALSQLE